MFWLNLLCVLRKQSCGLTFLFFVNLVLQIRLIVVERVKILNLIEKLNFNRIST